MSLVELTNSQPFTDRKVLKPSRSANVIARLALRGRSFTAFIKYLPQKTRTLELSYKTYFHDARMSDICKEFVNRRYL